MLQGVRGFWVFSDRNYSYLGVRGFARPGDYNSRVLLLVNGHRLNDNIYDSALIGTEFPLDLGLVERIEIVRGPGSSLYGTSALFGVINVITREPPITPIVEISAEAGTQFTGKARITAGLPQVLDGALFSATIYKSEGNHRLYFPEFDSPSTNHGVAQGVDGDRYGSAFALIRWKQFQLQGLVGSRTKVIPTASYDTIFNDPENCTTDSRGFVDLSYQRDFASGLQLTSRWFYDGYISRGRYASQVEGIRLLELDSAHGDWIGTETNISRPLGHRNFVTAGIEFRYNLRQAAQVGYAGPQTSIFDSHPQSSVWGLYAQDEFRVRSRLLLNAGIRFDHYSTFGSTGNPRIAAIFNADRKTAIKYSFGRAFRAPNAYEMFYSDGSSQEPNLGLQPERIANQTLSAEHAFTPTFSVIAEAFYNALSQVLNDQIDPATGLYRYVNEGSSKGKGLELELDTQRKWLQGQLSYTVQRSIESKTLAVLPNSPQHIARMNVQVPFPVSFLTGLDLQYQSPQSTLQNARIPDSLTLNLNVSNRKPILGFDLVASCYNLLDRNNYDPPSPSLTESRLQRDGRGFRFQITRSVSSRK